MSKQQDQSPEDPKDQRDQQEQPKAKISTGMPAALGGMGATGPIRIVRKNDAVPEEPTAGRKDVGEDKADAEKDVDGEDR